MLFLYLLFAHVLGHGRLTIPVPRFGTGDNNGNDNGPVSGTGGDDWVCRHTLAENTQPILDLTAGNSLTMEWDFSAAHVGDCAVYVTYETGAARADQKWFKIANLPKCREQNKTPVDITLPEWLPTGAVTIRWDWYALHQHPSVEFYSQCFDATITAGASAVPVGDIFTYKIPNLYPGNANTSPGYRNAFGSAEQFMTGPPCALNWGGNNCDLSACGTSGFIDVKGTFNSGRRRLCADTKTTSECQNANTNWNMCSGGDQFWLNQCQLTCGQCTQTSSVETTGTPSGGGDDSGSSPDLPSGCDGYKYDFNDGSDTTTESPTSTQSSTTLSTTVSETTTSSTNAVDGSNGNNGGSDDPDNASLSLSVGLTVAAMALVFV